MIGSNLSAKRTCIAPPTKPLTSEKELKETAKSEKASEAIAKLPPTDVSDAKMEETVVTVSDSAQAVQESSAQIEVNVSEKVAEQSEPKIDQAESKDEAKKIESEEKLKDLGDVQPPVEVQPAATEVVEKPDAIPEDKASETVTSDEKGQNVAEAATEEKAVTGEAAKDEAKGEKKEEGALAQPPQVEESVKETEKQDMIVENVKEVAVVVESIEEKPADLKNDLAEEGQINSCSFKKRTLDQISNVDGVEGSTEKQEGEVAQKSMKKLKKDSPKTSESKDAVALVATSEPTQDAPKVSEPRNSVEVAYFDTVNSATKEKVDLPKKSETQANPEEPSGVSTKLVKPVTAESEPEKAKEQSATGIEPAVWHLWFFMNYKKVSL